MEHRNCPTCGDTHNRSHRYCLACHAAYMREWRKTNKLTPDQRKKDNCRSYAGVYKRRGKLIQEPCKRCGNENTEMHHPDYDEPLIVEWLCRECHLEEHNGTET